MYYLWMDALELIMLMHAAFAVKKRTKAPRQYQTRVKCQWISVRQRVWDIWLWAVEVPHWCHIWFVSSCRQVSFCKTAFSDVFRKWMKQKIGLFQLWRNWNYSCKVNLFKKFSKMQVQSNISVVGRKSHSPGGRGLGSTHTVLQESTIYHTVVWISPKNWLKSTSFIFKYIFFTNTALVYTDKCTSCVAHIYITWVIALHHTFNLFLLSKLNKNILTVYTPIILIIINLRFLKHKMFGYSSFSDRIHCSNKLWEH